MAKVLVVDDSPFSRKLLGKLIADQGHEVIEAANGLRACEIISQDKPDILFTDLMMPDMSGLELLHFLQQERLTLPTVVVSSQNEEASRLECAKIGAVAFVAKPIKAEEVHRILDAILLNK